jgi:hypothetical protein
MPAGFAPVDHWTFGTDLADLRKCPIGASLQGARTRGLQHTRVEPAWWPLARHSASWFSNTFTLGWSLLTAHMSMPQVLHVRFWAER